MYLLEVMTPAGIMRGAFADYDTGKAQLDAIQAKLGERFSNDPDMRRHVVTHDAGEIAVNMDSVAAVSLVEPQKFDKATEAWAESRIAMVAEHEARIAEATKRGQIAALTPPATEPK